MRVLVTAEVRFDRVPDGTIWTKTVFDRRFWSRYLDVFDGVRVVSRVRDVLEVAPGGRRVDGDGVTVVPVPHYHGPWQYVTRRRDVVTAVRTASRTPDAVLFRVPGMLPSMLIGHLRRARRPYAVEVVGDPREAFAPGAIRHPLRPLLRVWLARELREHCRGASAASYVTRHALQRTYPPAPSAMSTYYSSLDLDDSAFVAEPRSAARPGGCRALVAVGSLEQMYKGPDVLIHAVKHLLRDGRDVSAVWVGDGACRPGLERQVRAYGLGERFRFAGELPFEAVRAELDRADLFVMPSRSEGLPRAMIEAMARALPCIGSRVGGVAELLSPEDMVPPGDAGALAGAVRRVFADPSRMARMSGRSLARAAEYRSDILQSRRSALYRYLRDETEAWRRAHA